MEKIRLFVKVGSMMNRNHVGEKQYKLQKKLSPAKSSLMAGDLATVER